MNQSMDLIEKRLEKATYGLSVLAALCLLAIMLIVTFGVIMRYVFGSPILGVNEIVQLAAVGLVMASLPYATAIGDHVAVDVFDNVLGKWGRMLGDIVSRIIAGTALGILAYRAWLKALDALEWGDATNMLQLPLWPFYAIIAVGSALCALIYVIQIIVLVVKGPQE